MVLFTYRYIWNSKNEAGELVSRVRQICGVEAEHEDFCAYLRNDSSVVSAAQIYVCEYAVDKLEQPNVIKKGE